MFKHLFSSSSDIFISYSHKDGFQTACLIAEKLRGKGYRVFLDTNLHQGKFDTQIYDKITQSKDFIVIVTKELLEGYNNPESWVYKEVIDALKKKKNIIPVRCFEISWPYQMPIPLKELPLYQDIKLDQRLYFNESVKKIIKYLRSYPVLKHQKTIIYSSIALSILIASLYFGLKTLSEPICIEQTNLMTNQMGKLNLALKQTKEIKSSWMTFYNQFHGTNNQSEREEIIRFYKNNLKHQSEEVALLENKTTFRLNTYEAFMLQTRGISKAEIEAFYNIAYPLTIKDIYQYIEILNNYIELNVPSVSLTNNENEFSYILHSINSIYYNYMALITKMPSKAIKSYYESSKKWGELPINLHANCTSSDYEHLGDIEMEKAQETLILMGNVVATQHLFLDKEQERLDSITTKVKHIHQLQEENKEKEKQLENKVNEVTTTQRRIIKECEFTSQDTPQDKWGKILRIATILNAKIISESKVADINLTPDLTSEDVLQELNKRFEQYNKECPEDELHIFSLQAFYNNAQKTRKPITGMLYIGTQNGEPHPILKVGDIITHRNGRAINSSEDFREAKKLTETDMLTFVRQEDGKLKEITQENPKNDLLIGLLKITLAQQ